MWVFLNDPNSTVLVQQIVRKILDTSTWLWAEATLCPNSFILTSQWDVIDTENGFIKHKKPKLKESKKQIKAIYHSFSFCLNENLSFKFIYEKYASCTNKAATSIKQWANIYFIQQSNFD